MGTDPLQKTGVTVTGDTQNASSTVKELTKWVKADIAIPDTEWASKFAEYIDKAKALLDALVTLLEGLVDFLVGLIEDAFIKLIKTLIQMIKDALQSFLDDIGLYVLFVPIRKRLMTSFMGLGDITPSNKALSFLFQNNPEYLESQAGEPVSQTFLNDLNRYSGGNYGFYTTVVESLYDIGDIHRPQFDSPNDYVAGTVMMIGTPLDVFGLLDDLWRLFGMFGDLAKGVSPATVPIPTGLKARAITYPTDAKHKASFLLEWDIPAFPLSSLPDFNNVIYEPTRYAVIAVKNDVVAAGAQNVMQLLGTRDLHEGLMARAGNVVVLKEDKWNYTKAAYIARDLDAVKDDGFYFFLAWKCELKKFNKSLGELNYWSLSNCAYVVPYPTLPRSVPPDWVRTPSVAELFPQLGMLIRLMIAQLEKLADRLISPAELVKQYVEFLKSEVERYSELVDTILEQVKRIAEMLQLPTSLGGIYLRNFFGKGGNNFFMTDLGNSLMPGFPEVPPFLRGDEYVAGVIFLVGGNRPDVEGYYKMLQALFPAKGDKENMVASLGQPVTEMEQQIFGEDIQVSEPEAIFDESLCPITAGSAIDPASEIPKVTFGEDFMPVSAALTRR